MSAVLRAEWTKFRTVRGWLIALALAAAAVIAFSYLVANGSQSTFCAAGTSSCGVGHPFVPTGPGGRAVADTYRYVEHPLTGNGTLTARVTSLDGRVWAGPSNAAPSLRDTRPGLAAWAKAGLLVTASTRQGSPYAAVMATGGHGVRFQYDYTHDRPGAAGPVTAGRPHWLLLRRRGDTITGYDSVAGTTWTPIGVAHLAGLPRTVDIGLFVTSPVTFGTSSQGTATQATATFDHLGLTGDGVGRWRQLSVGATRADFYPTLSAGSSRHAGATLTVSGSGDIGPAIDPIAGGATISSSILFGLVVALIVLVIVATMLMTVEYRRGLIRTTLAATPRRARVLAAKALVAAGTAFVVTGAAVAAAIPIADRLLTTNGNYVFPAGPFTELQVVIGAGALAALISVAAVALGAILRSGAGGVSLGITVLVGPYILGSLLPGSAATWLFRLTPAAGFATFGVLTRSPLVDYPRNLADQAFSLTTTYFPLPAWAGLAVLTAYTAGALGIAGHLLRRRDA